MLSITVASPCQTLCELLEGETASKRTLIAQPIKRYIPRMCSSPRVVLFITLLSVTDLDHTVLSNLELCLPGREDEICQPHAGLHNVM